jgi:hypothetical protein
MGGYIYTEVNGPGREWPQPPWSYVWEMRIGLPLLEDATAFGLDFAWGWRMGGGSGEGWLAEVWVVRMMLFVHSVAMNSRLEG